MVKKYIVRLSEDERQRLEQLASTGKRAAYTITHARILLKADANQPDGGWRDQDIQAALDISLRTVERVRRRCVEDGIEAALRSRPGGGRPRKIDGDGEAHLIALRCGGPPEGRGRWTLRLLAEHMVELGYVEALSHESVRQALKKTNCIPGDRPAG